MGENTITTLVPHIKAPPETPVSIQAIGDFVHAAGHIFGHCLSPYDPDDYQAAMGAAITALQAFDAYAKATWKRAADQGEQLLVETLKKDVHHKEHPEHDQYRWHDDGGPPHPDDAH